MQMTLSAKHSDYPNCGWNNDGPGTKGLVPRGYSQVAPAAWARGGWQSRFVSGPATTNYRQFADINGGTGQDRTAPQIQMALGFHAKWHIARYSGIGWDTYHRTFNPGVVGSIPTRPTNI